MPSIPLSRRPFEFLFCSNLLSMCILTARTVSCQLQGLSRPLYQPWETPPSVPDGCSRIFPDMKSRRKGNPGNQYGPRAQRENEKRRRPHVVTQTTEAGPNDVLKPPQASIHTKKDLVRRAVKYRRGLDSRLTRRLGRQPGPHGGKDMNRRPPTPLFTTTEEQLKLQAGTTHHSRIPRRATLLIRQHPRQARA